MHANYEDIVSRIVEKPTWWDNNGTPRYGVFHPNLSPDIYTNHVGLFRISCQSCGMRFNVEMHDGIWGDRMRFRPAKWHYGDPPIHGCVGDTMNCEDLAIMEFWTKESLGDWERKTQYEGIIDDD